MGKEQRNEIEVNSEDMGFLYGFSFFETVLVNRESKIFLLEEHIERLLGSLRFFQIRHSFSKAGLIKIVEEYIRQNQLENQVVRFSISAGNPQNNVEPRIFFSVRNNPYSKELRTQGLKLSISNVRRNVSSILVGHKTSNYLENFVLLKEAQASRMDDALLLNTSGHIAETTKCNLFFYKNNILFTPDLESGILPGITRQWVLTTAQKLNIPIREGKYTLEELLSCDEAFVTNSVMGIRHISQIQSDIIGNGQISILTQNLQNILVKFF